MITMTTQRRTFMKWFAAAPVFGAIATQAALEKLGAATRKTASAEVYRRLGVRPFINARGTWTYLSGSLELPAVRQAMEAASRHFVDMFELQKAAGKRLAELSGAESGMVTSGAAGAMAAAAAGCIAGSDPRKVWQLPDTTGLKDEVIMLGGRSAFDNAIRLTGGKLVLAYDHDELTKAINDKTAMVYTTWLGERLEKALEITKKAGVPLMLDDAAGIPPIDNLSLYAKMGLDLYGFSGGKGLCGPQCSGLLLGRKDLIEAALANCSPWEGAVCRSMKVGKEEIIGVIAAVEEWKKMDLSKLDKEWTQRVERIKKLVETVPGVTTQIEIPKGGNRYPTLLVDWDEKAWGFTVADCDRELRAGEPRIEVLTASNPSLVPAVTEGRPRRPQQASRKDPPAERTNRLRIISMTMQDGEDLVVGQRLREILKGARKKQG
jgi:L-seryl-tRNA(Ser) seleniumtransferase